MRPVVVDWTQPRVQAALEECLHEGLSASEAARFLNRKFGFSMSRQAVIGRAYRTNVSFRRNNGNGGKIDVRIPPTPKGIRGGLPRTFVKDAVVELRVTADEPLPNGNEDGCQWLHGDATKRKFCGHGTWPLSPWCPFHFSRVYQRPPIRRDVRDAA